MSLLSRHQLRLLDHSNAKQFELGSMDGRNGVSRQQPFYYMKIGIMNASTHQVARICV